ncbi:MAG: hypothetical protein O2816_17450, partial [Planctomycetota bacterium]|nr:hypothetical protein [Planctomycetota bacterium]
MRRVTRHPAPPPLDSPDIGEFRPADSLTPTAEEHAQIREALWQLASVDKTAASVRLSAVLALARSADSRVLALLPELRSASDARSRQVALLAAAWCGDPDWVTATHAVLRSPSEHEGTRHLAALVLLARSEHLIGDALDARTGEEEPGFLSGLRYGAALEHADLLDRDFVVSVENPNRRRVAQRGLEDAALHRVALAPWAHGVAASGALGNAASGRLRKFLGGPVDEDRLLALLTFARQPADGTVLDRVRSDLRTEAPRAESLLALGLMVARGAVWPGAFDPALALGELRSPAANLALGLSGLESAWEQLAQRLVGEGDGVPYALEALGQLRPPSELCTTDTERELWAALVLDRDAVRASAAAYACGQLQLRAMGSALLDALDAPRSEAHGVEVARAIGAIGDRRFVGALL